jgi:hypothetical protein
MCSGVTDNHDPKIINSVINSKYDVLWSLMKEGDLVEDLTVSGYRSQGRYIVKKDAENKLYVDGLHTDYDDYGTIPPEFATITKFPLGYFDELITNDGFHFKKEARSYWHSDICYMWLDTKKLKLDKLTHDSVKIKKCDNNYYVHTVVKYNKTNYLLLQTINKTNNSHTTFKLKSNFIKMFEYSIFSGFDLQYYKITSVLTKILNRYEVDKENIIMLDLY